MTNKAYIVINEQQEREVLNKLERQGIKWVSGGEKPTEFTPKPIQFPYGLFTDNEGQLMWGNMGSLEDEEIVYDGRKEEQMSNKYVVSQEFMNELEDWKLNTVDGVYINDEDINNLPYTIVSWWVEEPLDEENNNRLIAIIRWLNGEDVFEVEKPKKWVVRSIGLTDNDERYYVSIIEFRGLKRARDSYIISQATHFDTKEEAESWANSHQEVVEVVDA